jgi:surface protein
VASDPALFDLLQCSVGDAANGKYADADGVVPSCASQAGCITDLTACVASDPALFDMLQCSVGDAANGKYADADGVVQSCASQAGCITDLTACVASDPALFDMLQCSLGDAANGKYADAGGVVQDCAAQMNCIQAGTACLTNSSLTCTIADSGYFLDNGEVKECTLDCAPDEVLDKSACTGTTTTNGAVCKVPTPGQFKFDLTSGVSVSLPLGGTVNVLIDWGDGSTETVTTAGWKDHSYPAGSSGIKTVQITGTLTCLSFSCFGTIIPGTPVGGFPKAEYMDKLVEVVSFGDLGLISLHQGFRSNSVLTKLPSSIPSTVTDMSFMFEFAAVFDQDLSSWDVSNVTDMSFMFRDAVLFNNGGQPLSWGAKTAKVQKMQFMFGCRNRCDTWVGFNQDISSWDVSAVTNMANMFSQNKMFNQDISGWDVGAVTDFTQMFDRAYGFNQNLSGWNVNLPSILSKCQSFTLQVPPNVITMKCEYLPTDFEMNCGKFSPADAPLNCVP